MDNYQPFKIHYQPASCRGCQRPGNKLDFMSSFDTLREQGIPTMVLRDCDNLLRCSCGGEFEIEGDPVLAWVFLVPNWARKIAIGPFPNLDQARMVADQLYAIRKRRRPRYAARVR